MKKHSLKKHKIKKHDLKKNICWERDLADPASRPCAQITGNWYDCLLLFCGVVLCILSAYRQLWELLPGIWTLGLAAFCWRYVAGIMAVFAVCYGSGVLRRAWMRVLPLFPVTGVAVYYYLHHRLAIEDGILYLLRMYVAQICKYYECVILFPEGVREEAPAAFLFWLLCILIVVFILAAVIRKMEALLILPLTVLIAGLAVGKAPGLWGILFLFAGVLMLRMYRNPVAERVRVRLVQLVVALCICILTGALFSGYADKVAAGHDRMMERQIALEDAILALPVWDLFTQDGTVTNDAPRGSGREVLTIELSDKPTENLYLKTYAADRYEQGKWYADTEAFAAAASEQGLSVAQAGAQVWNMPLEESSEVLGPEDVREALNYIALAAPKQYDYTIHCRNYGKAAPLPYLSPLPEKFSAKADASAEKPWTKRQYSGTLMLGGNTVSPLTEYLISYYIAHTWTLENTWIGNLKQDADGAENDWYSQYVWEQDREWDQSGVTGERLEEYLQAFGWEGTAEFRSYQESLRELGSTALSNAVRMSNVPSVQSILNLIGTYSRDLDPLPAGTDPIDYFLNTSGEGYCVHFASAATLMLQTMGIPARYASGYVVFPKDFQKTGDGYTAVVTDARAHAWVEVYLDGFGWIPYETTPGFSDGSAPEETDTQTENEKKDTDQTTQENPDIPDPAADADKDAQRADEQKDRADQEKSDRNVRMNGKTGMLGTEFLGRTIAWWLGVLIALLTIYFVICLLVDGIRMYRRKQEQQIRREILEGHSREAILLVNRRTYRMLAVRVFFIGRRIRDDVRFCRALRWFSAYREAAVDVELYMKLVKQAYFSTDEMPVADAEIVYGIYERCRLKKRVRLKIANTAYRPTPEV